MSGTLSLVEWVLVVFSSIIGLLSYGMIHLWLWRRRCAPRKEIEMRTMPRDLPFGGRLVPRQYIQYSPSDLSTPYVPFGQQRTRLVHIVGGLKMKMPAKGDPVMSIPEAAFNRLMLSPSWLTPDKYPDQIELVKSEIGCMLSHEGAVRVRVQKVKVEGEELRSISERVRELTESFIAGPMTSDALEAAYSVLIRDWVDRGGPKFY